MSLRFTTTEIFSVKLCHVPEVWVKGSLRVIRNGTIQSIACEAVSTQYTDVTDRHPARQT